MLTEQEVFNLKRLIRESVDQHMLMGAHPTGPRQVWAKAAQEALDDYIEELKEGAYEV